MTFLEDYDIHKYTSYLRTWDNIEHLKNWGKLSQNIVKIRIFNHFFKFENMFFAKEENRVFLSQIEKGMQPVNTWNDNELVYLRFLYQNLSLNIVGYYIINKNHIVLCGPPDARTLCKSYKNNPKNTINKLRDIVPSLTLTHEILNKANLVVKNNE